MSDSAEATLEGLRRYRHLLPQVDAELLARMQGTPPDAVVPDPDPQPEAPAWPAPSPDMALDRALGCLLGLAVGEAVGMAVEGAERGSFPPVAAPAGGGKFGLAPGAWGDGTAMALCLADTLLACGTVDIEDFNLRLQGWEASGENAAAGRRLDVDPGNGALLRMAPLAIFATLDVAVGEALAVRQSRATQAGVASLDACRLFAAQLADALNGADKAQATRQRVMALCPRVLFVSGGAWRDKPREEIAASGEVVDTLEAGLWAVSQTDKFRDAVRLAANLGGNASGAAAVAGQLAGALYGASGIPEKWLAALAWQERLEFAAADLFEARLPAP